MESEMALIDVSEGTRLPLTMHNVKLLELLSHQERLETNAPIPLTAGNLKLLDAVAIHEYNGELIEISKANCKATKSNRKGAMTKTAGIKYTGALEEIMQDLEGLIIPGPSTGKRYLNDLPPEILKDIWEHLDDCSSACLGLAARSFYEIHRSKFTHYLDPMRLTWYYNIDKNGRKEKYVRRFGRLIQGWMAGHEGHQWVFDKDVGKFVDASRWEQVPRLRWR